MTSLGVARPGRVSSRIMNPIPACPRCNGVTARADLFTRTCACGWSGSGRVTLTSKDIGMVRWYAKDKGSM